MALVVAAVAAVEARAVRVEVQVVLEVVHAAAEAVHVVVVEVAAVVGVVEVVAAVAEPPESGCNDRRRDMAMDLLLCEVSRTSFTHSVSHDPNRIDLRRLPVVPVANLFLVTHAKGCNKDI